MDTKNLMLQYTIVTRTYKMPNGQLQGICNLTDGYTHVNLSRQQALSITKQASHHDRYEIGFELYTQATGDKAIDGFDHPENAPLQSVTFHHIFINPEHFEEVFADFRSDRKITFINKKKHNK